MNSAVKALPGTAEPLGVSWTPEGVNFAVYSNDAEQIELCLFAEDGKETARITLPGRTGAVRHGVVSGLSEGQLYGFRAHGPWRPEQGLRFNPARLLVDPYATRLLRPAGTTSAMHVKGARGLDDLVLDGTDTAPLMPKGVLERPPERTVRPPSPRPETRIVYELHAKGFSQTHPDIPAALRGTFAALAHPAAIRHFTDLGVTTLEVMPLAAWLDERHLEPLGLTNYWGYNPVSFFAPDPRLAPGGMAEVAATVDALHEAGFEVILDVVFNHTAESDERGQTLSLRGLDNRSYYRLADDPRFYVNDTGCGHTLALDRPVTMRLVTDALRHWAEAGGFDGFRFDLAPVLGRTAAGFNAHAPLFEAIRRDPVLGSRLMIAEPWDVGPGGYRLGQFPQGWGEWNDRYRDDVRRFWRGDGGVGGLATRLAGSSDVFDRKLRRPADSINFIAAHDGFTLADTVAFATKHNEANGEFNRDGHDGEVSWNDGVEGPGGTPEIAGIRRAHARAMLATLLLSRGTPMLSMGDELGRSQRGNNNAYAQDNPITWIDWANIDTSRMQFVASLVALRKAQKLIAGTDFLTGAKNASGEPDVVWLRPDGAPLQERDWNDRGLRSLGMSLAGEDGSRVVVWFHAGGMPLQARLPDLAPGKRWRRAYVSDEHQAFEPLAYFASFDVTELAPRSVGVFVAEAGPALPRRDGDAPPAMIDRLAEVAGIAPEWWEVSGRHTLVSPETKRALLAAMGLPHATLAQARESLDRLWFLRREHPAAPAGRAHMPPMLAAGARRFGLSAQLYTLRRQADQGVGDFTTLRDLGRAAASKGAAVVALNPFHALFPSDRARASPYQPSDRRFLDPAMIDLEAVPELAAGALEPFDIDIARLRGERLIDWTEVWRIKRTLLSSAFAGLGQGSRREAFEAFRAKGGEALARFTRFQAAEQLSGSTAFRLSAAPDAMPAELREEADFACYLQFLAEEQLARAADSGLALGFCRDIAVGAAPDGAEVWSAPGTFLKGVTVGAPPDPFSADGQVWNIPPLDPVALQQSDFAHYRHLLEANMRHAGALRVDHVMALTRLFVIPEGAPASEGAYLAYPLEAMLGALAEESRKARCMVVGEDLGTVPPGFRERLGEAALYSYRVLFFERDGARFRPASTYPAQSLACVATHDLATLEGWWKGTDLQLNRLLDRTMPEDEAARRADRAALADAVGMAVTDDLTPEFVGAVHGFLAEAPSGLVVAQVEDLAGEAEPVNLPGTDTEYPNWRRRLVIETDAAMETENARAVFAAMKQAGRQSEDVGPA